MNCKQCGAPMVLVRERDYYFCEYCGAYHFPENSEDGVRSLGEAPERIKCPVCRIPLNLVTLDDHYRGYQCGNCKGILFNRGTFRQTIESRRAKATAPPEPPTRFREDELHRQADCPKCAQRMSTHLYLGPGSIVIDTCGTCNLIWLDHGELGKVVNAPGKDRGVPQFERGDYLWEKEGKQKKDNEPDPHEIDLLDLLKDLLP
jgi:Zn-finger nucleic acid-binding protein